MDAPLPEDFYGRPRDIPTALEWQAGVIEAAMKRRDGARTEAERLEATDALLGCVRELPAWLRQSAGWAREPSPYGIGAVAGRHPGTPGEGPQARGRIPRSR